VLDEAPWIFYLSQFISGAPQRGFGVLPKRGCDTMQCEIFRFYKLHATKDMVEPISMIVPRKSEIFQDDIYPETAAPTPSLTGKTSKTKLKSRLQNPNNKFTTGLLYVASQFKTSSSCLNKLCLKRS
jgi:hypothetical protein